MQHKPKNLNGMCVSCPAWVFQSAQTSSFSAQFTSSDCNASAAAREIALLDSATEQTTRVLIVVINSQSKNGQNFSRVVVDYKQVPVLAVGGVSKQRNNERC